MVQTALRHGYRAGIVALGGNRVLDTVLRAGHGFEDATGNAGSLNAGFFNTGSDNSGIANSAPNPGWPKGSAQQLRGVVGQLEQRLREYPQTHCD